MPMDTITVYLDFLIALFIFVNHVDRLLDISQNDVAVAIVGLEDSINLGSAPQRSCALLR